jgi:hypothetical protein
VVARVGMVAVIVVVVIVCAVTSMGPVGALVGGSRRTSGVETNRRTDCVGTTRLAPVAAEKCRRFGSACAVAHSGVA